MLKVLIHFNKINNKIKTKIKFCKLKINSRMLGQIVLTIQLSKKNLL